MTDEEFYKERAKMKEEWRQLKIDGVDLNYDVSNTGKIRKNDTKEILTLSKTEGMKNCYEFYCIKFPDGTKKNIAIHRLMAIMFLPIPKKYERKLMQSKKGKIKLVVDHIDNVKYHNIISNLQWLTNRENIVKTFKNADTREFLVSEKTIEDICRDLGDGMTIYDASVKYGVSETLVHDIRYRLRYRWISEDYIFPKKQIVPERVVKICELLQEGKTAKEAAKLCDCKESTVTHILAGVSWKHISKNYKFPNKQLTEDLVRYICEELQKGRKSKDIADELHITKFTVNKIKWGDTWKEISKDYNFNVSKFKCSDEVVRRICEDLSTKKFTRQQIADRNGVSLSFVKDIKCRKARTDISKDYDF